MCSRLGVVTYTPIYSLILFLATVHFLYQLARQSCQRMTCANERTSDVVPILIYTPTCAAVSEIYLIIYLISQLITSLAVANYDRRVHLTPSPIIFFYGLCEHAPRMNMHYVSAPCMLRSVHKLLLFNIASFSD